MSPIDKRRCRHRLGPSFSCRSSLYNESIGLLYMLPSGVINDECSSCDGQNKDVFGYRSVCLTFHRISCYTPLPFKVYSWAQMSIASFTLMRFKTLFYKINISVGGRLRSSCGRSRKVYCGQHGSFAVFAVSLYVL